MRRVIAWCSAVAVAVGLAAVPPVAGAQVTTSTSSFDTTCYIAAPGVAGMGGPMDITPQNPVQIHVTSPESVDVGERFNVEFEIDPITVSLESLPGAVDLREASRLKLDLQRPAGTKLVDYRFTGGNIDVSSAQLLTVNESGTPDTNGNVLRLTSNGHHTIGNGGAVSTNAHGGLGMDLRGKKSLDFEFPRVTLTFEAERAGVADVGVRTQGIAAGYGANPASFLTLLASAGVSIPLVPDQWVPGYCSPRGSATSPIDPTAASMKTIHIVGLPTSSTLTAPETVHLRTPAEFVATVDPRIAGEVVFTAAGQRVSAPVSTTTGEARAELTFVDEAPTAVTATFMPMDPRYATAVSRLSMTPERVPTEMSMDAPSTTAANTRTPLTVWLPDDARGTVTFVGAGQERTVTVRDGQATTSMSFTEPGTTTVEAVFTPSATSAYASATASTDIVVEASTATTLVLNGLDVPRYVAEPVELEAVVNPAEGTADPQGRVEFTAGSESRIVDVEDGRATTAFTFGRAGEVEVSATYHPSGTEQSRAADTGILSIIDAGATTSELIGPAEIEPGRATSFRIVTAPAGADGTADVRIDGRVVADDVEIIDGEGTLDLTFPPAASTDRIVTVEFTPRDPRALRPHTVEHTVRVAARAVDEDAVTVTVEGPVGALAPGQPGRFRVEVTPDDEFTSPMALNGYLTVANNGEPVLNDDGEPVRIAVTRGVADVDITWTGGYPQSKYVQFIYHSTDGTERATGSITVTVTGEGAGPEGVSVAPGNDDDNDDPTGGGLLDLGSLSGSSSLSGSLGG